MTNTLLLKYQQKWIQDTSQVKVMEKGRRIGITWAEAAEDTLIAASDNGMDIWYIGYNKDMAYEFIQTCGSWAKKWSRVASEIYEEEIIDEDKKILSYSITFSSGYRITALSSRPSNLRGKQGKVVIDEAAFHEDLSELLKAAMALLIWGGQVVVISTHNGVDNPFNELVKDIRAGRLPYSLHKVTFMDGISDGLYEQIAKVLKGKIEPKVEWIANIYKTYGDDALEELDCVPSNSGGVYFSQSLLEGVMIANIPVLHFASPAEDYVDWSKDARDIYTNTWCEDNIALHLANDDKRLRQFVGYDVARSGDLSSIWLLNESKSLQLNTRLVVELSKVPFSEQRSVLFYVFKNLSNFAGVAIDATGIGQQIAEEARQEFGSGLVVEQKISEKFYSESMPLLKRWVEDRDITIPKDAGILSDFRHIRVINGIPKLLNSKNKTNNIERHGDTAIACVLAVWAREKLGDMVEPFSFVSKASTYIRDLIRGY